MNKKIFFLVLVFMLTFACTSKALASLTFTANAITGTTASTIDLGSGNALSLQTVGNGNIIIGNGNVGIGTPSPTFRLHVLKSSTGVTGESPTFSDTAITPVSSYAGQSYGGRIQFTVAGNQNFTSGLSNPNTAFRIYADNTDSATVTTLSGLSARVDNEGGGTLTNAIGIQVERLINTSNSIMTNLYGLHIPDITNSGGSTITNTYAIYVGDITTGTQTNQAYGLYESDANARNYFAGSVGVGATTPSAKLDVKDGKIASTQTTPPTPSVTGTGYTVGSLAAGSTDTKGAITSTVGANAGTLVVTFQSAYASAPICTVSPATATAQVDVGKMYVTTSTSALTLNFVASPTGGSETWNYICLQ